MTDLARLELRVKSLEVVKAEKRLDQLEKSSRGVEKQTKKTGQQLDRTSASAKALGFNVAGVVRAMLPLVGIMATLGAARAAVNTMADFEYALAQVRGIAIKTTETLATQEKQFKSLTAQARQLGATTRYTATQAGEAQLFLARTGFEVNEILAATPGTLNLASAGMLELGQAADIASNVLQQFRLDAEDMSRVGDVLVNTANSTNTSVAQLAEALSMAGPIAGALGLQLEEVAAAIGVMGDAGIQASLAGTQLRGIMSSLLGPTSKAEKTLQRLAGRIGETREAFDITTNSLTEIFQAFSKAETSATEFLNVFNRRQAAGAIVLGSFVQKLEEVNDANIRAAGEAERLAKIMEDTLSGAFKGLGSAIQDVFLSMGDSGVLGVLKDTTAALANSIRILSGVEGAWEKAGTGARILANALESLLYFAGLFTLVKLAPYLLVIAGALKTAYVSAMAFNVSITGAAAAMNIFKLSMGPLVLVLSAAAIAIAALTSEEKEYNDTTEESIKRTKELALMMEQYQKARSKYAAGKEAVDIDNMLGDVETQIAGLKEMRVLAQDIQSKIKFDIDAGSFDTIKLNTLKDIGLDLDWKAIYAEYREGLKGLSSPAGFSDFDKDVRAQEMKEMFDEIVMNAAVPKLEELIGRIETRLGVLGVAFSDASAEGSEFNKELLKGAEVMNDIADKYEREADLLGKSAEQRAIYLTKLKFESIFGKELNEDQQALTNTALEAVRAYFRKAEAIDAETAANERWIETQKKINKAGETFNKMMSAMKDETAMLAMEEGEREKLLKTKQAEQLLDEAGIVNYGYTAHRRAELIQMVIDEITAQEKLTAAKRDEIAAREAARAAMMKEQQERQAALAAQERALENLEGVWQRFSDAQFALTHTETDTRLRKVKEEVEGLARAAGYGSDQVLKIGDAAVEAEQNLIALEKTREIAEGIGQAFSGAFKDILFSAKDAEEAAMAFGEAVGQLLLEKIVLEPLIEQLTAGITSAASDLMGMGADTASAALETEAALMQTQAAIQLEIAALTLGTSSISLGTSAVAWSATAAQITAAAAALMAANLAGGAAGVPIPIAKGGVFSDGNLIRYAKGGILGFAGGGVVTDPYYFMSKSGLAVAGEGAKDEGIFPLERDSGGRRSIQGRTNNGASFPIPVGRMANGDLGGVMGGMTGNNHTTIVKKNTVHMHIHGVRDSAGFNKSEKSIIRRMKQRLD